ncbi:P-selectin glycoprotein ligand 1 [Epinephelus fuscoguttatus]|uniref:P-selectin glycoprotein ligand 1 n=1 Tax=Epinephelus fuscoguttatus TaxID=293821 RepID=UPI0020D1C549|nr:P-selectin glycoprotein ligand 1 [Epinephelus fuscoguttatus]XP_049459869.1 P-selectin glycoprotein ligand 1 [Epinephelus fuscoguttatus]
MRLLSMKTSLALLWGISVLLSMESMSASIPGTRNITSTPEPEETTKEMISAPHTDTHTPVEVSVAAPAETTASPRVAEANITHRSDSTNSASGLVAMNTVAAVTSSSGPPLPHTTAAVTTAAGATHPSHIETANPTVNQIHQQSPTTVAATARVAASATVAVSSPQHTLTTEPEVTSKLPPPTSPANSTLTPVFIQTLSNPSASTTTIMTPNPTSETAPVFDSTKSETSTNSTDLLTTRPVSVTRTPISTSAVSAESSTTPQSHPTSFLPNSTSSASTPTVSTTSVSSTSVFRTNDSNPNVTATDVFTTDDSNATVSTTDVPTINASTSPAGILIPHVTKRLPVPTTKPAPATTAAPHEVSKSTEAQPCSHRGLVKQCLIAVSSLAALATIFMVTTIILCAKLSTRKYKVRKPQPATEMMCISALLPERTHTYTRQRNPVSNGVLVIHGGADSDEDIGDNLTLSSFLPENDRFV